MPPLVAISGQAATTRMHKESHQYLDLVNLFAPISKFRTQVVEPETIPEVVRKAFKQAEAEKPGVSYIDFPENVAKMEVDGKKPLRVQQPHAAACRRRRGSARRPTIISHGRSIR